MNNCAVLLSSYNGEKYIKEQIQSILRQNYDGDISILIRDDGSRDKTVEIIKNIQPNQQNRNITLYQGNNIGPQKSFLELIQNAPEADYYFLSDQDDVWKSDHVSSAVDMLRGYKEPTLYCSNYSLVDAELNPIKENAIESKPQFTPLKAFFYNKIPGCCMAWNSKLQSYLRQMHPGNVMMHDRYIASFACFIGEVVYDPQSHILHRIHGNNVIGYRHKKIIPYKWIVEKIKLLKNGENYDVCKMAGEFLIIGENIGHSDYKKDIILLYDYKKDIKKTIDLLRHPDTHDVRWDRSTLSIRMKILFRLI